MTNDPLTPGSAGHSPRAGWLGGGRRTAQIALGIAISGALLWLTLRQIDLTNTAQTLRSARWWFLVPAVITYYCDLAVRSWRWSVLLSPVRALSWHETFPAITIGYMGNMLLPARLGELLRAAALARRGIPAVSAVGGVATERVLDGLTTVGILLVFSRFLATPAWVGAGTATLSVLFLGALLALVLLLAFRARVLTWAEVLGRRLHWAGKLLVWADQFLQGLVALRRPGVLLRAIAIGFLAWSLSALEYYWIFRALDLPLGAAESLFAVAAIGLSTVIPSAPGYVGTMEFAGVAVLGVLGVTPSTAFSAIILVHLLQVVPVTPVGLFYAWREGVSFSRTVRG